MMHDFEHPRLGKLEYDREDGWDGWITLPLFMECRDRTLKLLDSEKQLRLEDRTESFDEDDLDSEFDSEEIDEQIHRIEGKLELRIVEVGKDGLSPAQERSVDYLLDHEQEVLDIALEELFRLYREQFDEAREFGIPFGSLDQFESAQEIRSSEQLKEMISFSYVEIDGNAIDGFVKMTLTGGCAWDEEHGFEVEILHDRVLEWEEDQPSEYPCAVPGRIDLSAYLPIEGGTSSVEFQIYGRWSGIYEINEEGMVLERKQCMLCSGHYWDPDGIEDVRSPAANHLRMATNPLSIMMPGLLMAGGCLAPVFLVLGFLVWGGFYCVALALSVFEFGGKIFHPLMRMQTQAAGYLRSALLVAVSIAGIVYWQTRGGGGANEGFLSIVGWIVWWISAYAFLTSVRTTVVGLIERRHSESPIPLTVTWPNLLFSVVVGVALWKTYVGDVSKLHLIWAVPATFLICLSLGLRRMMHHLRTMVGKKDQDDFFGSSHKETYYVDPKEEDERDERF